MDNQTSETATSSTQTTPKTDDKISEPAVNISEPAVNTSEPADNTEIMTKVAEKIAAAQNVLIALSSDPSVDELATAIGLSLFLDRLGKRATAIYSGETPNVLEFLKPDEVFETTADTLQDFVIAINKEKADHLRYKLDGDYVKIFITPFKNRISEKDLNFSYGDFNVDLVLALNVANGVDLDAALREYGRIMHDAVIVNVTTGEPGKLGEIEWSNPKASSIAEMISRMLTSVTNETIEKDEATAFLTGIVAATQRFSNAKTTPETMKIASDLMRFGADQQLISKNVTPELDNMLRDETIEQKTESTIDLSGNKVTDTTEIVEEETVEKTTDEPADGPADEPADDTTDKTDDDTADAEDTNDTNDATDTSDASTNTDGANNTAEEPSGETPDAAETTDTPEEETTVETSDETSEETPATESTTTETEPQADSTASITEETSAEDSSLLDDLKAAEQSLAGAGTETIPEPAATPSPVTESHPTGDMPPVAEPATLATPSAEPAISPTAESATPSTTESAAPSVTEPTTPPVNPAAAATPFVPAKPEINGVPEINYTTPTSEILPPPPAPPVDPSAAMPPSLDAAPATPTTPETPAATPATPEAPTVTPSMPPVTPFNPAPTTTTPVTPAATPTTPAAQPQPGDSDAFKIPAV